MLTLWGWHWGMSPLTTLLWFCSRSCTITGLKATAQPSVISATKQLNVTRAWQDCIVFGVRSQWVTSENESPAFPHSEDCASHALWESCPERSCWMLGLVSIKPWIFFILRGSQWDKGLSQICPHRIQNVRVPDNLSDGALVQALWELLPML